MCPLIEFPSCVICIACIIIWAPLLFCSLWKLSKAELNYGFDSFACQNSSLVCVGTHDVEGDFLRRSYELPHSFTVYAEALLRSNVEESYCNFLWSLKFFLHVNVRILSYMYFSDYRAHTTCLLDGNDDEGCVCVLCGGACPLEYAIILNCV